MEHFSGTSKSIPPKFPFFQIMQITLCWKGVKERGCFKAPKGHSSEASKCSINRKRSQNNGLTACPDLISVKSPPDGYCNCYITLVLGVGRLFRDSKGDLAHRARTDGGGGGAYVCVVRGLSRDAGDGWEPICARETECACKVNKTTDNPNYPATTTILRYMCISCICLRWLTSNT